MNTEQTEIYEFLKTYSNVFVSALEISKRLGNRGRFHNDRNWARPVLRRMEMEGLIESNPFGEYRLKKRTDDTTSFKKALAMPGMSLGDTTIIALDETEDASPH